MKTVLADIKVPSSKQFLGQLLEQFLWQFFRAVSRAVSRATSRAISRAVSSIEFTSSGLSLAGVGARTLPTHFLCNKPLYLSKWQSVFVQILKRISSLVLVHADSLTLFPTNCLLSHFSFKIIALLPWIYFSTPIVLYVSTVSLFHQSPLVTNPYISRIGFMLSFSSLVLKPMKNKPNSKSTKLMLRRLRWYHYSFIIDYFSLSLFVVCFFC